MPDPMVSNFQNERSLPKPSSVQESFEAEALARAKFIRVLQTWASDRLAANASRFQIVEKRKAA